MKKTLIALATVLAIVAGCAKENFQGTISSKMVKGTYYVTATICEPTKAHLDKTPDGLYRMFWDESEAIGITYSGLDTPAEFTLIEGAGTAKGKFELNGEMSDEVETVYAVSPYQSNSYVSGDSLYVQFPTELVYNDVNLCAEGGNFLVGRAEEPDIIPLRNAFAYIKLVITGTEEETVKTINVAGKDGKPVAGTAAIWFEDDNSFSVNMRDDASSIISVDMCGMPFSATEPLTVYIPVAPCLSDGFFATIFTDSGKAMTVSSPTPVVVNTVVEMPEITFEAKEVAEIDGTRYFSIDEAVEKANESEGDVVIKLIDDCYIGSELEMCNPYFKATIDLNGHTLSAVGPNTIKVTESAKMFVLDDSSNGQGLFTNVDGAAHGLLVYGPATINANITSTGGGYPVRVYGGSLIITGGTILGERATAIYIKPDNVHELDSLVVDGENANIFSYTERCVISYGKGDLILRNCHMQSHKAAFYSYEGHTYIYGGFYRAKTNVIYLSRSSSYNPLLTIYGGQFHQDSIFGNSIIYAHLTTDSTQIYGGFFSHSPTASYLPAGYFVEECDTTIEDLRYTKTIGYQEVADINASVQIENGEFVNKSTVSEAFKTAMQSGKTCTVKILEDCILDDTIQFNTANKITLDLNGKTVTCPGKMRFNVKGEQSELVVMTSVDGGGIFNNADASGSHCLYVEAGTLTINNGIFRNINGSKRFVVYATTDTLNSNNHVKLNINGGEFYSDSVVVGLYGASEGYVTGGNVHFTEGVETESNRAFYVTGKASCVFDGGGRFETVYGYSAGNNITFKGGTFTKMSLRGTSKNFLIEGGEYIDCDVNTGSGIVTVKDGTFTCNDNSGALVVKAGTAVIDGGTFNGGIDKSALTVSSGSATVNGGSFTGSSKFGTIRAVGNVQLNEGAVITSTGTETIRALYVGDGIDSNNKGSIILNGAKVTSECQGVKVYGGSFTANSGSIKADSTCFDVNNSCNISISDGYFYSSPEAPIVKGSGAEGKLFGGHWSSAPAAEFINEFYIVTDASPVTYDDVTYPWSFIENPDSKVVASVDGKDYKSIEAAFADASAAAATADVDMKLLDDCSAPSTIKIPASDHKIKLDVNGKTFTGNIEVRGNLDVTDSSAGQIGKIVSSKTYVLKAITPGKINMSNLTVELLEGTYDIGYAIGTNRDDTGSDGEFNVSGSSKIISADRGAYCGYAYMRISEGVTFETVNAGFYFYSYGKFYMTGGTLKTGGKVALSGTSNANSIVEFQGGRFFSELEAKEELFKGNASSATTASNYKKKIKVSGGYWSHEVKSDNLADGFKCTKLDAPEIIDDVSYGYKVEAK